MDHAIIIRLHYQPGDPKFPWRLAFFQSMCLPRLLRQTDPDFEIWVRCHPAHTELVAALHPRIRPFQGSAEEDYYVIPAAARQPEGPGHYPEALHPVIPRFHIQTRLDSDDLVSRHFVARIKKEVAASPAEPLLVSFQPYKLDLWSLTRYRMKRRYHANLTSMFLALYQPNIEGENYRQIYDFNHCTIWKDFPRVVTVREGYCDLVIHGENSVTKIMRGDEQL